LRSTGPFGQRRIADLLANRHRLAQPHQLGQIVLGGVIRHACHRDGLPRRLTALRERDVQQSRGLARVIVEKLVEVAHAEEQQHVRMCCLRREVLAHKWGM
jgi:hypothetical protein